jgi:3-methyl-2-oxobutanoate hydroxymethyltransferase
MTTRPSTAGKLPLTDLAAMKQRGEKIVMVTAYDYPSGRIADAAGVDVILVGDSAAMTVLGHDSTVPATMEDMLLLSRAAARGAVRPLVVADMPFGSYQVSTEEAVRNAVRFVKDAGVDAVKVEGAGPVLHRIEAIVGAGVPVVGHIGLTPQTVTALGGWRAQGRTAARAQQLVEDAVALERAGCFAVVLECIPSPVAARISETLRVPTIGIGAGPDCDGQVLVFHDMLGLYEGRSPRFVKRYADVAAITLDALERYAAEVRSGAFPDETHEYAMPEEELTLFESAVR